MFAGGGVARGKPHVRMCDHHTLSHTHIANHEDRSQVAVVSSKCTDHCPTQTHEL